MSEPIGRDVLERWRLRAKFKGEVRVDGSDIAVFLAAYEAQAKEIEMKHLLILGGGTAGTITANKLRKKLSKAEWDITVVDRDDAHRGRLVDAAMPVGDHRSVALADPQVQVPGQGGVAAVDVDGEEVSGG